MGICRDAQIVLPSQVHETIFGSIDDDYITRFCTGRRTRGGELNSHHDSIY